MGRFIKGSGGMARNMGVGYGKALRGKVISGSGITGKPRALAYTSHKWAIGTKANSKTLKKRALVLNDITMAKLTSDNIAAIAQMAKVSISGLTETITKASSLIT
jgi:hypothetical protein